MSNLTFSSTFPVSQQQLYNYHATPGAFQRLSPPWEKMRLVNWKGGIATQHRSKELQMGDISTGTEVQIEMTVGPLKVPLVAKHIEHQEPGGFTDVQLRGPFKKWRHVHQFQSSVDSASSILTDDITYEAPFGFLTNGIVKNKINALFAFRHRRTAMDLQLLEEMKDCPKLKVAISGASGLIGQELSALLKFLGHEVFYLVRHKKSSKNNIFWSPSQDEIDQEKMEGLDVVIHLAGHPIANYWTKSQKEAIAQSRIQGTSLLARTLKKLKTPPKVFISTSAIGIYGNHPSEIASEDSTLASDFLGMVCQQWEQSSKSVTDVGVRLVNPRIGVVLSAKGGALVKSVPPILAGIGGKWGDGMQWMSWIAIEDVLRILLLMMVDDRYEGAVNLVAPNPVQNNDFIKTLGKVLRRPTFLPLPALVLKTIMGEMGKTLLLEGRQVRPDVLLERGYSFQFPNIEDALRFELGRF